MNSTIINELIKKTQTYQTNDDVKLIKKAIGRPHFEVLNNPNCFEPMMIKKKLYINISVEHNIIKIDRTEYHI